MVNLSYKIHTNIKAKILRRKKNSNSTQKADIKVEGKSTREKISKETIKHAGNIFIKPIILYIIVLNITGLNLTFKDHSGLIVQKTMFNFLVSTKETVEHQGR